MYVRMCFVFCTDTSNNYMNRCGDIYDSTLIITEEGTWCAVYND